MRGIGAVELNTSNMNMSLKPQEYRCIRIETLMVRDMKRMSETLVNVKESHFNVATAGFNVLIICLDQTSAYKIYQKAVFRSAIGFLFLCQPLANYSTILIV